MKRTIAIALIIIICVSICSMSAIVSAEAANEKISDELHTSFEVLSSSDSVMAWVTLKDVDHDSVMQSFSEQYPEDYATYMNAKFDDINKSSATPLVAPNLNTEETMKSISLNTNSFSSSETNIGLQQAIERKRAIYKEYYSNVNADILSKYFNQEDIIFSSNYAPAAIVETTELGVKRLARNSNVISIAEFTNQKTIDESLGLANIITRADYVRDTFGNKGAGVKIGMVEAKGVPDKEDNYLKSATIYTKPGNNTTSPHATTVASIIVGTDTNGTDDGLVPNAQLYCCFAEDQSENYAAIEWLIGEGVNIINMSKGSGVYDGHYDEFSAWVDHVAVQHDVHVVKSAGNYHTESNPNSYITSPGMAYNVITVGNLNPSGSATVSNFIIAPSSCYRESSSYQDSRPEKPNLVAPGIDILSSGGTSVAAPQVTGVIAQLCSLNSTLKVKQAAVGAILMASAAEKVDAVGNGAPGDSFAESVRVTTQISNKEGAGILDARWARGIVYYNAYQTYTIDKTQFPFTKTVTIDASSNSLTRVAIFWLQRNTVSNHSSGSVDEQSLTDLDISLYDPNGNYVGASTTTDSNYEIIQFVPTVSGAYQLIISGVSDEKEHVGFAAW